MAISYSDNFRKTCHFQVVWIPTILFFRYLLFLLTSTDGFQMPRISTRQEKDVNNCCNCTRNLISPSIIAFEGAAHNLASKIIFLGQFWHFLRWKYQKHFFYFRLPVQRKNEQYKTKCGLWTVDCGLRTADCGLRTADCGLRTADCGLRTMD